MRGSERCGAALPGLVRLARRRYPDGLVAAVVVCVLALQPVRACAEAAALAVIVNPSRGDRLDRRDVTRIYLRTRRFWNDGSPIVPLNLEAGSPARTLFTARVFDLDQAHLTAFWNAQYFHGIFPPTVLSSSESVKRYVANDPRAIGYVDTHDVDETVKVVLELTE